MTEIFKVYKEYYSPWNAINPTHHVIEVSNCGNIKFDDKLIDLNEYKHQRYYIIHGAFIHRAVAELFIPNPENKPYIDHIDTNKHNNRVDNLRWVTHKENMNNPITRQQNSNRQKGLQTGEKNPIYGKHRSEETKNLIREDHYGRCFINNGEIEKFPKQSELNKYLNNGWVLGRLPFSRDKILNMSIAAKNRNKNIF